MYVIEVCLKAMIEVFQQTAATLRAPPFQRTVAKPPLIMVCLKVLIQGFLQAEIEVFQHFYLFSLFYLLASFLGAAFVGTSLAPLASFLGTAFASHQ